VDQPFSVTVALTALHQSTPALCGARSGARRHLPPRGQF